MITTLRHHSRQHNVITALIAIAVLALAFLLGQRASSTWLGLLVVGIGAVVLLQTPRLGLLALVAAALLLPYTSVILANAGVRKRGDGPSVFGPERAIEAPGLAQLDD